jgi:quinol monooxygenase YgiN
MILIAGTIDVHPEDVTAFVTSEEQLTEMALDEEGCLAYRVARDISDPNRLFLFECWSDQAALDAHYKTPHFLAHRQRTAGLRHSRDIDRYTAERLQS